MQKRDVAAATQAPRVGGVGGVALYLEDLPVFDVGKNAAILMAKVTGGFLDLNPRSMDIYSHCHVPFFLSSFSVPDGNTVLLTVYLFAETDPQKKLTHRMKNT
jgi:hypothetical protein